MTLKTEGTTLGEQIMKRKSLILMMEIWLLVGVTPAISFAGTLVNKDGAQIDIIVWKSEEAFEACIAEKQSTGTYRDICLSAVKTIVKPGTKVRRIEGVLFLKIQILDGPSAGTIGYVGVEFYKP
jgi:hypothetical protein